jgi:hypothetical protein
MFRRHDASAGTGSPVLAAFLFIDPKWTLRMRVDGPSEVRRAMLGWKRLHRRSQNHQVKFPDRSVPRREDLREFLWIALMGSDHGKPDDD